LNYAASLAVVALLAFFFPLVVRVGSQYGVPRSLSAATLLVLFTFFVTTSLIRFQVARHRRSTTRLEAARAQVASEPDSPRAYYVDGEHLAAMLLRLGRRREAAEIIDRYARLRGAHEAELLSLREALTRAERRRRGEG
jgi:NhaP-type Na+/H+ or K+/H+ antiporter